MKRMQKVHRTSWQSKEISHRSKLQSEKAGELKSEKDKSRKMEIGPRVIPETQVTGWIVIVHLLTLVFLIIDVGSEL